MCAARRLALELAFDTTDGSHLASVDEFLPLLDVWFMKGSPYADGSPFAWPITGVSDSYDSLQYDLHDRVYRGAGF